MKYDLPVVSIIGRPNVGKSSLFNLLIKNNKSITHELEGTTRDIVGEICEINKIKFYLCDTAGYLEKGDEFNSIVQKKVREAINISEIIIFLVDGKEINPIDYELARFLKINSKEIILVANKVDNKSMEDRISEVYELGFENFISFSVLHKRGLNELKDALYDKLKKYKSKKGNEKQSEDIVKIAIVGKPNVGKSQLLNSLAGYERSIVSETPGTTRDAIDEIIIYKGKKIQITDTAGLRRKSKIEEDIEYYSNVKAAKAIEQSDVVIQLINANEEPSHQDKRITDIVMKKKRGLVIAFNKWDLVRTKSDKDYEIMNNLKRNLLNEIGAYNFVPIEFISAKEKYKINNLLDTVLRVYENYNYRIPTSTLNEWLTREIRESNLDKPISNLRIYYGTQIYSSPPGFIFFINKKEYLRKDYPRFLENKIRLAFEFTGVPIKLIFKEKKDEN